MKWLLFALILITGSVFGQTPFKGSDYTFYYQVNVGKTNGSLTTPSAWLEIGKDSTTKGLRVPRIVDTAAISSPIYGIVVYQISDNGIYFRDKFGWRRLSDATILNNYLLKSDSTTYYPYHTNPKNYVINELDPVANAKTVTINTGTGLLGGSVHAVNTNPSFSLTADNTTALWNANAIRGVGVSASAPTNGQILQYNGSQYIPVTFSPSGTVTSVGLALPGIFTVTNSPVTTSGTLTGSFNNQLANVVFAGPNGSSGQPTFRSLTNTDLPTSSVVASNYGNDTAFTNFNVNSKGIIANASTISLTLDRVLRGNPTSSRRLILADTTGTLYFGINTDYGLLRYYSTSDINGTSNLIFESGDNADSPKEGFLFLRDSSNGIPPKRYDTTLRINGNGITASGSIMAMAPAYSSGGISALGRNNTTGRFETFTPSPNGFTTTTDANYTVQSTDRYIVLIHTTALRTLTLPNPVGISGQELWIRCAANGSGEWQTGTTGFINCGQIGTPPFTPSANQPFSSNSTTHLISDGTNWYCFQ